MTDPPPGQPFSPPPTRQRRRPASRRLPVEVALLSVVVLTAVALVLYFALRTNG